MRAIRRKNGLGAELGKNHAQIAPDARATLTHTRASATQRDGDGKSGADKLFFFRSALRVHTDRRGQTCMHTGYKKIKKSKRNLSFFYLYITSCFVLSADFLHLLKPQTFAKINSLDKSFRDFSEFGCPQRFSEITDSFLHGNRLFSMSATSTLIKVLSADNLHY